MILTAHIEFYDTDSVSWGGMLMKGEVEFSTTNTITNHSHEDEAYGELVRL